MPSPPTCCTAHHVRTQFPEIRQACERLAGAGAAASEGAAAATPCTHALSMLLDLLSEESGSATPQASALCRRVPAPPCPAPPPPFSTADALRDRVTVTENPWRPQAAAGARPDPRALLAVAARAAGRARRLSSRGRLGRFSALLRYKWRLFGPLTRRVRVD